MVYDRNGKIKERGTLLKVGENSRKSCDFELKPKGGEYWKTHQYSNLPKREKGGRIDEEEMKRGTF